MRLAKYCVFVVMLALLCAVARAADSEQILIWTATRQHDRVISALTPHRWQSSSNPHIFITYCDVEREARSKEGPCRINPESAGEVSRFASALDSMWHGRTTAARHTFELLANDEQWRAWGLVGLAELASYTEDVAGLDVLVRLLRKGSIASMSKRYADAYEYYQLNYLDATCDWSAIRRKLSGEKLHRIAKQPTAFSTYARALFMLGEERRLAQLLKAASPVLGGSAAYIFSTADHALLTGTNKNAVAEVKKYAASHPQHHSLTLQQAYIDLLDRSEAVAAAALQKLHEFAQEASNDVPYRLGIAATLMKYRKPQDAAAIVSLINSPSVNLEDFAMYHVYMAWHAVYLEKLDEARSRVERALRMAPKHVPANWLAALIAKKQDDVVSGIRAASNLFQCDPYDENNVAQVLHFRRVSRAGELDQAYHAIVGRQKYYGEVLRRRITEQRK